MIDANDDLAHPIKRFKLSIVTGMWQRHNVFKMFAEGVKVLQDNFKHRIDISCCVAGSEGSLSEVLVLKYPNFHYVEMPNVPLGVKMDAALLLAKKLNPDYCLMVGSDDLIGIGLMNRYLSIMESRIDFACLLDCYFYDTVSRQGLYWAGYRKPHNTGKAAGIGKLISRGLLDKINWNCFPPGFDKILDTGFERQLSKVQHTHVEINLKQENLFALDIKSEVNMTKFDRWDNCTFMNGKDLLYHNLPEHLANLIYGT